MSPSFAPTLLLSPSYLIFPHPSTFRLRLYLQTSVHRCLPLLTPTKLTKKLEKARKTRPFIDSLVEGSRPQHTPHSYALTGPHFTSLRFTSLQLVHCTRAQSRRKSQGHATDLAHAVLSTPTLPRQSLRQTYVGFFFLCPFHIRSIAHLLSRTPSLSACSKRKSKHRRDRKASITPQPAD